MKMEQLDKNFIPDSIPKDVDLEFYSIDDLPFRIFGIFREGDHYARVPKDISDAIGSLGISVMRKQTAGGRVSFKTNSRYVVLKASLHELYEKSNSTSFASAGFDIYEGTDFCGMLYAPYNYPREYSMAKVFPETKERKLLIDFPLFSPISELLIGIDKGASLEKYNPYSDTPPIVYYGSSITQGALASRPGNAYEAKIAREIGVDFINLGFGGNARGEEAMARYIASLPMSVFVMDYEHNSSEDELKERHERFFKIIREKNPNLPIIFVTAPDAWYRNDGCKRRAVIMNTYVNAKASGDENVYFVDGSSFYQFVDKDFATTDGCHPNDLGFYYMATGILPTLKKILNK